MKLIVGLGNPGSQYKDTRHNVGFMCIDAFLATEGVKMAIDKKFNAEISIISKNNSKVIVAKPLTYMNLSGNSVSAIANYYKINSENIIIIHDDLNLDFGKLRIKRKGSAGGQNGIKDIISKLATEDFNRLKFGIGLDQRIPVKDYVLSKFSKNELIQLEPVINDEVTACQLFAEGMSINDLMNRYN